MKRSEFSEWCRAGVRLLDGATGTNLMRAGMPRGVCTEQWVLEHPQTILKLQRDYAAAGSEVLYAPTFCANRCALKGYGLEERLHTMNVSLVQLTRKAAGAGVLVAGDMTTLGHPVEEDGAHSYQALLRVYREQAEVLHSSVRHSFSKDGNGIGIVRILEIPRGFPQQDRSSRYTSASSSEKQHTITSPS